MAIRHLIAAGRRAAICSIANVAAEPARPTAGNSVARTFSSRTGLAYGCSGGLYVTELSANRVTRIDQTGVRRVETDEARSSSGIVVGRDGTGLPTPVGTDGAGAGAELAVGNRGDGSVRRYRYGAAR